MVFSSLVFLYAFLPLVLLVYYLVPRRFRNPVLLLFSLLFYGWGEPVYILLMVASFSAAYGFGFWIVKYRVENPRRARFWTIVSVSVSLFSLFFFKYYDFTAATLSRLPFWNIPLLGVRLPVGISFYTFQILSYTIDLSRGNTELQRNYVSFGTYVSFFPQLIAGPIVRYREIAAELAGRREILSDFAAGVQRFCVGLGKKVLLGDPLAAGYLYFRESFALSPSALGAWGKVLFYALHLYFDFSGYSDMAIGLGRMFGFHLPENFNYPYIATSISDFWRRWHITLSAWFREYVYIPLGGNRRGKWAQFCNLLAVWLLTGLWHGANWNFILWGLYFLILLLIEHFLLKDVLKLLPLFLRRFCTFFAVLFGFLLFSEPNLTVVWQTLGAFFGANCTLGNALDVYHWKTYLPLLSAAALCATPLPKQLFRALLRRREKIGFLRPIFCGIILLFATAFLVAHAYSPFEYFQF